MKATFFAFCAFLSISLTFASPSTLTAPVSAHDVREEWEHNPLVERITDPEILKQLRGLRQRVRDTGCDVNMCFAFQGDDFISDEEFEDQKNFADLLIAILTTDMPGNYCAVQYGLTTKAISPLIGDKLKFLESLRKAKRVGGFDTNIAAALGYTGFQLRPRTEDANKIIILGDGLESVGFAPIEIAKRIRKQGTNICAVAIGGYSTDSLLKIVGEDENKIVEIDYFFELAEVINGLVFDVCGYY